MGKAAMRLPNRLHREMAKMELKGVNFETPVLVLTE